MSRSLDALLFVVLLAALSACNSSRPPEPAPIAPGSTSRSVTPPDFKLPDGSGCGGAIARYRAIMENDLSMGHVDKSVYGQIQQEIGEAESGCSGGQESRALSLLHASKARHGYPG
jgi:hypothetical protein